MSGLREAFRDPELTDLVILADAVSGLMHELNNCLNRVALQASVVQMQGGDALSEETAVIRREAAHAATLLRPLTLVRQRQRQAQSRADLHDAVREVLREVPGLADRVRVEMDAELPELPAAAPVLRRLMTYFLRLGLAGSGDGAAARLWAEHAGGRVRLVLEDARAGAESPAERFDPEPDIASPESLLERLAFQSLLRLTNGVFEPLAAPQAGVALAWDLGD